MLGVWVVYKSLVFAGSSCLLYPTHLWCFLPKVRSKILHGVLLLPSSQNPHPITPCVVLVHQTCHLFHDERCFVGSWSIKTPSSLGLPVFIILHTSDVFPKQHGKHVMVLICLLGFKMPRPSSYVWVWSTKTAYILQRCCSACWPLKFCLIVFYGCLDASKHCQSVELAVMFEKTICAAIA